MTGGKMPTIAVINSSVLTTTSKPEPEKSE
jgi:hypothetical protein